MARIELVRVRMLETRPGSPDGIQVQTYTKDVEYTIPPSLARIFLGQDWAERVVEPLETKPGPRPKAKARKPRQRKPRAKKPASGAKK